MYNLNIEESLIICIVLHSSCKPFDTWEVLQNSRPASMCQDILSGMLWSKQD